MNKLRHVKSNNLVAIVDVFVCVKQQANFPWDGADFGICWSYSVRDYMRMFICSKSQLIGLEGVINVNQYTNILL